MFYFENVVRVNDHPQFREKTAEGLAGRCLLDTIEYLRRDLNSPGRFSQLVSALAMRLCTQCLTEIGYKKMLNTLRPSISAAYHKIRSARGDEVPYYGEDIWDWVQILKALFEVYEFDTSFRDPNMQAEVRNVWRHFVNDPKEGLSCRPDNEWWGPAIAASVYEFFSAYRKSLDGIASPKQYEDVMKTLKKLALTGVDRKHKYLDRDARPIYYWAWHYGQVLRHFPNDVEELAGKFQNIDRKLPPERNERAYALARVIQGLTSYEEAKILPSIKTSIKEAVKGLNECQELSRPLGDGVVGDNIKGSLNALEATWPISEDPDRVNTKLMLDSLTDLQKSANTVGIVVAIENEIAACIEVFERAGAKRICPKDTLIELEHEDFFVKIVVGKANLWALEATRRLILAGPSHLIMIGCAATLGWKDDVDEKQDIPRLQKPKLGDVVVATSLAPYQIREKFRKEITNEPVPFEGRDWWVMPTDPTMYDFALQVKKNKSLDGINVFYGPIITGPGILDHAPKKENVLAAWPGGLAFEEESFVFGMACTERRRPFMVIRGISDYGEGDKKEAQDEKKGEEDKLQQEATRNAAKVAIEVIKKLMGSES